MVVTRRALTLAEFLALPEEEPALEFEQGRVTQKVSPSFRHSALQTWLVQAVNLYGIPRKLARAFTELRTTFGPVSYVPDVSVYTWDRIPVDDNGVLPRISSVLPDVAVEIVSEGQGRQKLLERCRSYVEYGVRAALLLDERHFTVTEVRPNAEPRVYRRGERIDLGDVIAGFSIDVDELFGALQGRPDLP